MNMDSVKELNLVAENNLREIRWGGDVNEIIYSYADMDSNRNWMDCYEMITLDKLKKSWFFNVPRDTKVVFSPDCSRAIYVDKKLYLQMIEVNSRNTRKEHSIYSMVVGTPCWSPDGKKIACPCISFSSIKASIRLLNVKGTALTDVTKNMNDMDPVWYK